LNQVPVLHLILRAPQLPKAHFVLAQMLEVSVDLMQQEQMVIVSRTITDESFGAKKPWMGWAQTRSCLVHED
jgi:hypothetical protein